MPGRGVAIAAVVVVGLVGVVMGSNGRAGAIDLAVRDPGKYKNIYQAMMNACDRIEKRSEAVQIIAVDNDLPDIIENTYPGSIAAYFRGDGRNGISRGLIDDAHLK